jgi:hypothetical protein
MRGRHKTKNDEKRRGEKKHEIIQEGKIRQNRKCTYKRNIEARSRNHCCSGKALDLIYSVCVYHCSISYPACKVRAPYCRMWPEWLYKFHQIISQKVRFLPKVIEHKMCVLTFSTSFVRNISHSKKT